MTDPITQSMMQGAAGAGGDKVYVDEVFNTKPTEEMQLREV